MTISQYPDFLKRVNTELIDQHVNALIKGIEPHDKGDPQSLVYALASLIYKLEGTTAPQEFAPFYLSHAMEMYAGTLLFEYIPKIVKLSEGLRAGKHVGSGKAVKLPNSRYVYTFNSFIWEHVVVLETTMGNYMVLLRFGDPDRESRASRKASWLLEGSEDNAELEAILDYIYKPKLHIRLWDTIGESTRMAESYTKSACLQLRYGDFRDLDYVASLNSEGFVPGIIAFAKVFRHALATLDQAHYTMFVEETEEDA